MTPAPSLSTQVILLLSEPLLTGERRLRPDDAACSLELLTPGTCRKLFSLLTQAGLTPADLLSQDDDSLLKLLNEIDLGIDLERLRRLLGRRNALNRAIDQWQEQAIWVGSPFDKHYPYRFRERAGEKGPLVCYGCGNLEQLARDRSSPSLSVVGPRDAHPDQMSTARDAGILAAEAGVTLVSGGARGIDQAAMQGALRSGGWSVGVLADRLARVAAQPDVQGWIEDQQLTLISIRDPLASFSVGYAMQRNKLIYALADATLVVSANHQRGGTWSGAVEQLRTLHYSPVYVWRGDQPDVARDALIALGASVWPQPSNPAALRRLLATVPDEILPPSGPAV